MTSHNGLARALGIDDQQNDVADQEAQQNADQRSDAVTARRSDSEELFLFSSFSPHLSWRLPCRGQAPPRWWPSGSSSPTISPSYMTRMRSDRFMTSSSSRDTSRTRLARVALRRRAACGCIRSRRRQGRASAARRPAAPDPYRFRGRRWPSAGCRRTCCARW